MLKKNIVLLALVAAVAYLLGAKAGREKYESLTGPLLSLWTTPEVKAARKQARKRVAKSAKASAKRR